jgi:hypothetical protein
VSPEETETQIDALYDLPVAEFVVARNALAKALAKTDKTKSAEIKALPKPSVAAHALNRLVRRRRSSVDDYLDASAQLARAQLSPDADFRGAASAQRQALDELVRAAGEIAGDESRALAEKIARTLRTIAVDERARQIFLQGRLSSDLADAGFEGLAAMAVGIPLPEPAPRPKVAPKLKIVRPPEPAPEEEEKSAAAARKAAAEKNAKLHEAREKLREAEKILATARERLESARGERAAAEAELIEARRALKGAEHIFEAREARVAERRKTVDDAEAAAEEARSTILALER